eukprot:493218_1
MSVTMTTTGSGSTLPEVNGHAHPNDTITLQSENNNGKGNLQALLTSYSNEQHQQQQHSQNSVPNLNGNLIAAAASVNVNAIADTSSLAGLNADGSSDISIQLDVLGRERSSTLGSFRDRGLTFDSEFDLGLGMGLENTDSGDGGGENMNIDFVNASGSTGSARASPSVNITSAALENNPQRSSANNGNVIGNIISANSSSASAVPASASASTNSNANSNTNTNANLNTLIGAGALAGMRTRARSRQLDHPSDAIGMGIQVKQEDNGSVSIFAHTPPSAVATSYERTSGKRARAGSFSTISGRLRSMSDLETRGIIDRQQKGILKDLIISGDDALQKAIDKYEGGDTSALESMIKSGALQSKNTSDIDLLGDLDLDFLSMKSEFGTDVPHIASKAIPIPGMSVGMNMNLNQSNSNSFPNSRASTPSVGAPHTIGADIGQGSSYDGINDLDFNADYGASTVNENASTTFAPQETTGNRIQIPVTTQSGPPKKRADSIADLYRSRANSLAFGILLDEPGADDPVGRWMDLETPSTPQGGAIPNESRPLKKRVSSQVIDANGGLLIISDNDKANANANANTKTNASSNARTDTSSMTKAEISAMKRKEREEKKALREAEKALKDAEKLAKREKKQRDAQLKKANKASKKNKKNESGKKRKDEGSDDDEPMIVISGTGRPRSLSDPNLTISLDENGLMNLEGPPDWVGAYSPESRKIRIERFLAKRHHRVWVKKVKYDVRKNFADSRLRVKGRFVKKADEMLMRDLMSLT